MLLPVYDAKGEMFEVRPDVAKRLVVSEGWSMDAPKHAPVAEAHPHVEPAPIPALTVEHEAPTADSHSCNS